MKCHDETWVETVDRWEKEKNPLFFAFLTAATVAMPFICAVISVHDAGRTVAFAAIHKRWPSASDLMGSEWTRI